MPATTTLPQSQNNGISYPINYPTIGATIEIAAANDLFQQQVVTLNFTPVSEGVLELYSGTNKIWFHNVKAGVSGGLFSGIVGCPLVDRNEALFLRCTGTTGTGYVIVKAEVFA